MQLFLCAHVYSLKPINCSIKENRRKEHKILKTIKLTGNKQPRDRALAITHETNDVSPVYITLFRLKINIHVLILEEQGLFTLNMEKQSKSMKWN